METQYYTLIEKQDFLDKINKDGFLEYSNHFENYYGTPREFVMKSLEEKDVLLEIDVNGGLNVKESFPEAVLVMITPPSVEEVRKRLIARNTESIEKIDLRMQRIDYELGKSNLYDYSVINDDLLTAVKDVEKIIEKEKNKN